MRYGHQRITGLRVAAEALEVYYALFRTDPKKPWRCIAKAATFGDALAAEPIALTAWHETQVVCSSALTDEARARYDNELAAKP